MREEEDGGLDWTLWMVFLILLWLPPAAGLSFVPHLQSLLAKASVAFLKW